MEPIFLTVPELESKTIVNEVVGSLSYGGKHFKRDFVHTDGYTYSFNATQWPEGAVQYPNLHGDRVKCFFIK